jgi:predicted Rossmann fold flavoprotein
LPRVAVIGAGAAGTMAAIFAATAGAETLLLERTPDGGRKILISGGGRCNLLPARLDERRFVTESSPNALRKIVRSWPLPEQIEFFERELALPLREEEASGKLFPVSNRARDVRDGLLRLARKRGVRFIPQTTATDLTPGSACWTVALDGASPLLVDTVIVASGGLSVPNTGSDGAGLRILSQLGHTINPTYPALTPVLATPAPFAALAGVSLPVTITARDTLRKAAARGGFLFTHRGYSGPSVLDVSHIMVRSRLEADGKARLLVQWTSLDEAGWERALRAEGTGSVVGVLRRYLPDRLASALAESAGVKPTAALAQLRRGDRKKLIGALVQSSLPWNGDEGYKKAEVTGGGVSLEEIDARTMESRRHPGLFICGEALDAFGPIGGYNFLWAWATGRAAGHAAGTRVATRTNVEV